MGEGWGFDGNIFPNVERHGYISEHDDTQAYTMEKLTFRRGLKAYLEPRQYKFYQALRSLKNIPHRNDLRFTLEHWYEQFNSLPEEFEAEKEQLIEALDGLSNYGQDIGFEISPRNVVAKDGKLILVDCFFIISQLNSLRAS